MHAVLYLGLENKGEERHAAVFQAGDVHGSNLFNLKIGVQPYVRISLAQMLIASFFF